MLRMTQTHSPFHESSTTRDSFRVFGFRRKAVDFAAEYLAGKAWRNQPLAMKRVEYSDIHYYVSYLAGDDIKHCNSSCYSCQAVWRILKMSKKHTLSKYFG